MGQSKVAPFFVFIYKIINNNYESTRHPHNIN